MWHSQPRPCHRARPTLSCAPSSRVTRARRPAGIGAAAQLRFEAPVAASGHGREPMSDPSPKNEPRAQEKPAREPWIIRTYAGFGDARQANRRYRENLKQGQRGLSIAFDLPTQNGYDPDAPVAA